MARRLDSGWRDRMLAVRHSRWGHTAPAAGMPFPMLEYDRGEPVAVISYQRRGEPLPSGREASDTHGAFGRLYRQTGEQLPLFTVQYDPRNWAYRMFGHNDPARAFLDRPGWVTMTEDQYAGNLYRLRGRYAPDLAPYGVNLRTAVWHDAEAEPPTGDEAWPHQMMSERRRNFEPVAQVRMAWRNPCTDIDLAVVDRTGSVALLVDYKAPGAKISENSTNLKALSSLRASYGSKFSLGVAAMLVSYEPAEPQWKFRVRCLNQSAQRHLSYALGSMDAEADQLTDAVVGTSWVDLSECQWVNVLNAAMDV